MPAKVFVTGTGIISAIGKNAAENFAALSRKRHGIAPVEFLGTAHKEMPAGEVKLSNEALSDLVKPVNRHYLTRTALLGMHAASEAFESAGLTSKDKLRIGLISATSVGGMDRSELFYNDFMHDHSKGRLRDVISHDCGESTERIALQLGIRNYVATISTACSSSANAIMLGARLIKNNLLDIVIAGGTDALARFTLNGFNTLMILDRQHCRPFDDTRTGLNLGEGAGFIVLESEASVKNRGVKCLARLSGYGNANDAYHQTASSPEGYGAVLAMNKAFGVAGIAPSQISYINAHGTGTPNNDLSEGTAVEKVFADGIPLFSSTKAFTGHTLGAAGGIEAVYSVMSIINSMVFPNLNFKDPMKELSIRPVTEVVRDVEINHVLSNSFGFGGNNSSLIFSKA
jgi:3-oxoacyl-(acyl-carrier-protein) synthase